MDERRKRNRDEQDLLSETERDAEIKRRTNVRNALGPIEGSEDAPPADSTTAPEEGHSGRSRSGRTNRLGRSDED